MILKGHGLVELMGLLCWLLRLLRRKSTARVLLLHGLLMKLLMVVAEVVVELLLPWILELRLLVLEWLLEASRLRASTHLRLHLWSFPRSLHLMAGGELSTIVPLVR